LTKEDTARELLKQADEQILETQRLLLVSFVARQLACHPETVRSWIRRELVQFVQLPSGGYRIPRAECDRLMAERGLSQKAQKAQRAAS